MNIDCNHFQALLVERRSELLRLLEGSAAASAPVELDQEVQGRLSRMDSFQVQEMEKATSTRRQIEIRQIDAALARIKDKEYGYCVECGETIPLARRQALPGVRTCIDCQSGRDARRPTGGINRRGSKDSQLR